MCAKLDVRWIIRLQLVKYTVKPPGGKDWEWIFACSLCTELWGLVKAIACLPVKNCFFVSFSLMGLVDASPVCFQSLVFYRPVLQMATLKAGALDVQSKSLAPQGEAGSWVPFWLYGAALGVRLMAMLCLSLSDPFYYRYFPSGWMCRCLSTSFWIFRRGSCSVYICIFGMSMGGGKFRSLLCHLLGPESIFFFKFIFLKETQWGKCNLCLSITCEQTWVENVLWGLCVNPSEAVETCLDRKDVLTMENSPRNVCKWDFILASAFAQFLKYLKPDVMIFWFLNEE